MSKIAVLIPCYNESQTIEKVVREYHEALPEADIYVYDNNSTDGTDEIARRAGAIVRYEYRQGKGNVVRSMFRDIDADCYLMIDGDDTYPAENARQMVDLVLDKGVDMVVGDRLSSTYFTENKRPFHNSGNRVVRYLINKLFNNNVRDIMTGYRAFSRMFVKSFPVLSKGFEIETEMTIHAVDKNFLLEEVPVTYRDRPEGSESKLNTFSDGFRVLRTIASLFREYKPFKFFLFVAALLWLIAIAFFIPVFIDYLQTGLVLKFPTVIVCGVVATMGALMWICGIILEVIVKKHRQLYELMLNQMNITLSQKKDDAKTDD
ncbi:glycosyltransferase [Mediterraneibacter glycyrrhizinilyticus]|nr:glycosyltransferase family 2 protein [Mediterraneibacter glycyrrhizinilyticus]MBM6853223.1 glycosyltransferase [Mediterraneibacter glycyrrhizinilyticus]